MTQEDKGIEVLEFNTDSELTNEEIDQRAKEWEENFRASVIDFLDHFMPVAHFGAVNINYLHPEIVIPSDNEGESKRGLDETKAVGVDIVVRIGFGAEFPIPQQEESEE